MEIANPIARITAAIILIFSLVAVVGVFGELTEPAGSILNTLIGAAVTYLFVAQAKAAGQ